MNILFICSRNQWRSTTAEEIYRNHPEHKVKSAGTASSARIKLSSKLIEWADVIFAMEKKHKQIMLGKFAKETEGKKIIVLNIPDDYNFMDSELIEEIKSKIGNYGICS